MILLVHLLLGAAIGSSIKNVPLAIILAFLSHYFLDFIPHVEYDLGDKEKKPWIKMLPSILKVAADLCLGILLVCIFSKNQPIIYVCAFFAILPDGLTLLNHFFPNKLSEMHDKLHQKIHFLKYKKISNFWRITSQAAVVIISIIILVKT